MKKQIIIGIGITVCAAVWPRSAEVGDLPAEPIKTAATAEIEARSEEMHEILLSADIPAPEAEVVAKSEPAKTEIINGFATQKWTLDFIRRTSGKLNNY